MSRIASRGMLLVGGITYRIERTEPHCYSVVRLLDDVVVGTFQTLPTLRVRTAKIELTLMRDIVRAALRSARTSAVMRVAPVFQPDEEPAPSASPAGSTAPAVRTPSSAPPSAIVMA